MGFFCEWMARRETKGKGDWQWELTISERGSDRGEVLRMEFKAD